MQESGEHREQLMSRREFLKFGAGALAFLSEIGIPKKILAELEELLKERAFISKTFEDGIKLLEKEVYTNKLEKFWVYVEKKEKGGWIDVASVATDKNVTAINLTPLLEDREVSRMHFAHTHPFAAYSWFLPKTHDKNDAELGKFPIPPSPDDIIGTHALKAPAIKNGASLFMSFSALDPTGSWEYDVNIEHPGMQRVTAYLEEGNPGPFMEFANEYKALRNKFYEKNGFSEESITHFANWAMQEYGISLKYTPRSKNE